MPLAFPAPAQPGAHWLFRNCVETENGAEFSHQICTQSRTATLNHLALCSLVGEYHPLLWVAWNEASRGFYGTSPLITLQNYYCWGQIYGCSWTLRRTVCSSQGTLCMPLGVFILAHWCGCVCQSAFVFFTSKLMSVENSFHGLEAIWQISVVL